MQPPHLQPGDQIHHYVVEARVGGGGTATVYRVRHAILQHTLALKVLNPEHVLRSDLRLLFLAEGRIQAAVRHPAIVMVTDAVVDAPRRIAGLVMEYVEGPNLSELIGRLQAPPSTELVRSLAIPILEALHHAHGEGIVHRDVKPSNVLLSRDASGIWHPRVADFGIAWVLAQTTEGSSHLAGTPAFMCPEQIHGESPSIQWDVFAFGCLLHELATGVHPFESDDTRTTQAAILNGPPVDPLAIRPDLDPVLERTIRAALHRSPGRRAQSCGELLDLLMESSSDLPTPVSLPTPPPPSDEALPPTFIETAGPEHQQRVWRIRTASIRVGTADVEVALGHSFGLEALHCLVVWDGSRWTLTNKSISGTRVNGARVTTIPLENGDLIRVGMEVLKFHTSSSKGAEEPRIQGPRLIVPAHDGIRERVVPISMLPVVIGSSGDVDVSIDEPLAAARHCQVSLQGIDVIIEDLDSSNGTLVDGHPVHFRRLEDGATITIGGATLRYRSG